MSSDRGLVDVALADLEILARALDDGRVDRLDAGSLQSLGLGHLAGRLAPIDDLDAVYARPALDAVIAERRRWKPHLELVWTGPEAGLRPARDTAVVVRELFDRAQQRVLVGGFRFDHGEEILAPLYRAMAERGVEASFFLDIERTRRGQDPAHHAATHTPPAPSTASTPTTGPSATRGRLYTTIREPSSPAPLPACTPSASSSTAGGPSSAPPTSPTAASAATSKPVC